MKDPAVRIVLMPRYTSLYGAQSFYSPPINVTAFEKVLLTVWKSNGIGATPADVGFKLAQSTDLGKWYDIQGSFSPASAGAELTTGRNLDLEWARLEAIVTGASPGITVWAVGAFIKRERAS